MENFSGLLVLLTAAFLVLWMISEFSVLPESWERMIRAGLFLSAVPCLILITVQWTGFRELFWAIPLIYSMPAWPRAGRALRRMREDLHLKKGSWRCRQCGTINEAAASVCLHCEAWRS